MWARVVADKVRTLLYVRWGIYFEGTKIDEYDRYRKRAFEGNKEILMDALTSTNSNATVIGIAAVVKNKPDDDTETAP